MRRPCHALLSLGFLIAFVAIPQIVFGQQTEVPDMVTDRPDFTESSEVVRKGSYQFETGLSFEGDGAGVDRSRSFTAPSSLMRIGLGHRAELRIGGDGLLSEAIAGERHSGYSDLEVGTKFVLLNQDKAGFDMAVLPMVSLPVGKQGFSSETFDPTVKLTWARSGLPAGFDVTGNFNVSMLSDAAGRFSQKAVSVSFGHDLVAGFGSYVEVFGFSRLERDGTSAFTFNGGVSHPVGDRMQFDVEAGHGITPGAPDWFVGMGFAVRGAVRH